MKWVNKFLIVCSVLFLVILGREVIRESRTASTVGIVHLWRDRQMMSEGSLVRSNLGRLATNKWLVAWDKTENKTLEVMDLNVVFFAGHPNERSNVEEKERLPWLLIPLILIGLVDVLKKEKERKLLLALTFLNLTWAIRRPTIDEVALRGTLIIYLCLGLWGVKILLTFLKERLRKK